MNSYYNIQIRYFSLFLISLLFISCHHLYRFEIENASKDQLLVKLSYDKNYIDTNWNGDIESALKFNLGSSEIVSIDTLECNISFKLQPTESITIDGGVNIKPNFAEFKKIEVFKNDSVVLLANRQILKSLYQEGKNEKFQIY